MVLAKVEGKGCASKAHRLFVNAGPTVDQRSTRLFDGTDQENFANRLYAKRSIDHMLQ